MAGVQGQVLGHLVRRGMDVVKNEQANIIMAKLHHDAELYENSGPEMDIEPKQLLPVVITFVIMMIVLASIRYTINTVVATLTMVESTTTTAIIDEKPPAYNDEPDAPLEKEVPLPVEAATDVEVTLIKNERITGKISTTIRHLNRIGGFRARWRGLGWSAAYHLLHGLGVNTFAHVFHLGILGQGLMYMFVSLALARVHVAWTHSIIAYPSNKRFCARMVPRKASKALLLPTLVVAAAEQATLIVPICVAIALQLNPEIEVTKHIGEGDCRALLSLALRVLAVAASGLFVALAFLLPATVTLTRIEAALLPEDEDTIVPFDRQAIIGDIDLTARGSARAVYKQASSTVDNAVRWRLIKLALKMVLIEFTTFVIGLHVIVAELYVFGGEKLALLIKSGAAQLQLAAIEANERRPHPHQM